MMENIIIPEQFISQIIKHANFCLPEEACGIIAGIKDTAVEFSPITNELHSSSKFRMDPQEQLNALIHLEEKGLELLAIFHSHPSGPDHPSQTDLDEFAYPDTIYLICYLETKTWKIKAYQLDTHQYMQINIVS